MFIKQIYTSCLAEASYYIESNGEAVIIDPIRDSKMYLELAKDRGAALKYILETHFHADFISGHLDLARATGAEIVFGPTAKTAYPVKVAEDRERLKVGDLQIEVLHTPGHTLESSCYLLLDEAGKHHAVFTGDTLFIGDVGRPDLAIKSDLTREDLAGMLYDSLHNVVLKLDDAVVLYPGHGAGSSCGKSLSSETVSTIGEQRQSNYAVQQMTKADFVKSVTEGLLAPPPYFFNDAMMNKNGYQETDSLLAASQKSIGVEELEALRAKGVEVLDVRLRDAFEKAFIPNSFHVGMEGLYALWVGTVVPMGTSLVIVAEAGEEKQAIERLARVGHENIVGYLEGGIDAWKAAGKETDAVRSVDADQFLAEMKAGKKVLDVRKPGEVQVARVADSINIRLQELESRLDELDKDESYLIHCAGGYRSMIASAVLKRHGFHNITNVYKGYEAIEGVAGMPLETEVCPSKLREEALERSK